MLSVVVFYAVCDLAANSARAPARMSQAWPLLGASHASLVLHGNARQRQKCSCGKFTRRFVEFRSWWWLFFLNSLCHQWRSHPILRAPPPAPLHTCSNRGATPPIRENLLAATSFVLLYQPCSLCYLRPRLKFLFYSSAFNSDTTLSLSAHLQPHNVLSLPLRALCAFVILSSCYLELGKLVFCNYRFITDVAFATLNISKNRQRKTYTEVVYKNEQKYYIVQ